MQTDRRATRGCLWKYLSWNSVGWMFWSLTCTYTYTHRQVARSSLYLQQRGTATSPANSKLTAHSSGCRHTHTTSPSLPCTTTRGPRRQTKDILRCFYIFGPCLLGPCVIHYQIEQSPSQSVHSSQGHSKRRRRTFGSARKSRRRLEKSPH